jgi:hypothetical protein
MPNATIRHDPYTQRLAASGPIATKSVEQRGAQHNVAVTDAFAAMNMNHHPPAMGISDLQMGSFHAACSGAIRGHQEDPIERIFCPIDQACHFFWTVVLRQTNDLVGIGRVGDAPTETILGKTTAGQGFAANLVLAFAALSLLLAAVGLYGVLSYLVTQRVSEIGIRIALGAQREQILRLILFDGLRPALLGLILGLAASAGATQLIRSMLYGTAPYDPVVIAAVILTLLSIASITCIFPALRRLAPESHAGLANRIRPTVVSAGLHYGSKHIGVNYGMANAFSRRPNKFAESRYLKPIRE